MVASHTTTTGARSYSRRKKSGFAVGILLIAASPQVFTRHAPVCQAHVPEAHRQLLPSALGSSRAGCLRDDVTAKCCQSSATSSARHTAHPARRKYSPLGLGLKFIRSQLHASVPSNLLDLHRFTNGHIQPSVSARAQDSRDANIECDLGRSAGPTHNNRCCHRPSNSIRKVTLVGNTSTGARLWPPWPFNHLQRPENGADDKECDSFGRNNDGSVSKDAKLFWSYFCYRAKTGARAFQQLSSDISFHLPPAAPPLLLIALLPSRKNVKDATEAAGKAIVRRSSFVRRVSRISLGVAVLSWAHYEIRQQKRLVPLPLREEYRDYKKAILPPFLPEIVPPLDAVVETDEDIETEGNGSNAGDQVATKITENIERDMSKDDELLSDDVKSRVRRELEYLYKAAPKPEAVVPTIQALQRKRMARNRREGEIRRKAIMEELLALQALKKISRKKNGTWRQKKSDAENAGNRRNEPLGYALVTGASRGIGRAIAVELARYSIPLILVARNTDQLKCLADEISSCYGVSTCILTADLSQPDAAANVYKTTRGAGLRVDILINNAGICSHGELVSISPDDIQRQIQINAGSVAALSRLYGEDMKRRRRGRMLFVSSITGAVPAGPRVATYAATKAFEKSFALSVGKELEPYGIGVTCLMPGAVKNTAFKSKSNTDDALCWKIPGYAATAEHVAHRGVRAMLEGDPEVCPGLLNKAFLRIVTPMLPQRLTTMIVELAWNPFEFPWQNKNSEYTKAIENDDAKDLSKPSKLSSFWEPTMKQPRVLSTPITQPKRSFQPSSTISSEIGEKEPFLEVLGVGDDHECHKSSTYTADESGDTSDPPNVSQDSGTSTDEEEDACNAKGTVIDEDGMENAPKTEVTKGDAMLGVLANEVEAGLVDVIPVPPPSLLEEGSPEKNAALVQPEIDETMDILPKSSISQLADDIEAEIVKMIPPDSSESSSEAPSDALSSSDELSGTMNDRDLEIMQYVD